MRDLLAGTVAYMAPEVLQTGSLSMAADVYSFAMIMLELWTGETIYKDFPAHQVCCEATVVPHLISPSPSMRASPLSMHALRVRLWLSA